MWEEISTRWPDRCEQLTELAKPNRSIAAHSPSTRRVTDPTTLTWPQCFITWPIVLRTAGARVKPNPCYAARWRSMRRHLASSTSTLAFASTTWDWCWRLPIGWRRPNTFCGDLCLSRRGAWGATTLKISTVLSNLASILKSTNRLAEAEALMRRALAIDEKALGPDRISVGLRLNGLAQMLMPDRLAEAEPLLRRALSVNEKSVGPEHTSAAVSLGNPGARCCNLRIAWQRRSWFTAAHSRFARRSTVLITRKSQSS